MINLLTIHAPRGNTPEEKKSENAAAMFAASAIEGEIFSTVAASQCHRCEQSERCVRAWRA